MKKISLVLSGGGARGIAHIGVLAELEKQGYDIHSITGTSMGAVVGGVYAAGNIKAFEEWILNLHKIDIFKLVDFTLFNNGFIQGDKVFKELTTFIEGKQIQHLPIKYAATATDLISRKEVLFTEGSLYDALRASVAIPNVLTPVKKDGSILVDGGVINNIPINHAHRIDNDLLIAVNVNAHIPLPIETKNENITKKKDIKYQGIKDKFNAHLAKIILNNKTKKMGYFDIMNTSFEIMRDEMVKLTLEKTPPDVLVEIPRHVCNIYDFYKGEELIKMGRQATIKSLNDAL